MKIIEITYKLKILCAFTASLSLLTFSSSCIAADFASTNVSFSDISLYCKFRSETSQKFILGNLSYKTKFGWLSLKRLEDQILNDKSLSGKKLKVKLQQFRTAKIKATAYCLKVAAERSGQSATDTTAPASPTKLPPFPTAEPASPTATATPPIPENSPLTGRWRIEFFDHDGGFSQIADYTFYNDGTYSLKYNGASLCGIIFYADEVGHYSFDGSSITFSPVRYSGDFNRCDSQTRIQREGEVTGQDVDEATFSADGQRMFMARHCPNYLNKEVLVFSYGELTDYWEKIF